MSKQYDGIYRYDTVVETDKKQLTADLTDLLDDPENFSGWQRAYQRSAELKNGGNTITAYLFVPEDAGALKSFINLRTRGSGADVPFDEGSAVLSEKTARLLGVDVGGAVTLENDDGEDVSFTVTGITENYIYHYLYIAPEMCIRDRVVDHHTGAGLDVVNNDAVLQAVNVKHGRPLLSLPASAG